VCDKTAIEEECWQSIVDVLCDLTNRSAAYEVSFAVLGGRLRTLPEQADGVVTTLGGRGGLGGWAGLAGLVGLTAFVGFVKESW
jgi:hypothetical protein